MNTYNKKRGSYGTKDILCGLEHVTIGPVQRINNYTLLHYLQKNLQEGPMSFG